jgi:hypothetical protein
MVGPSVRAPSRLRTDFLKPSDADRGWGSAAFSLIAPSVNLTRVSLERFASGGRAGSQRGS